MKLSIAFLALAFFSFSSFAQYEKIKVVCTVKSSERNLKKLYEAHERTGSAVFCVNDTYYSGNALAEIASDKITVVIRAATNYYSGNSFLEIAQAGPLVLDMRRTKYYSSNTLIDVARNHATFILESSLHYYSAETLYTLAQLGSLVLVKDDNYYGYSTIQRLKSLGAQIVDGPMPGIVSY
jgi:hypothetical protein